MTWRELAFGAIRRFARQEWPFVPVNANAYLHWTGRLGYFPRYRRPRTFNEKLVWLLRETNEPRVVELSDKLEAKAYARSRVPWLRAARVLTVAESGAGLDLGSLPATSVLKVNNSSGVFRVLHSPVDEDEIIDAADRWLSLDPSHGRPPWEAFYRRIEPRVFIEEFVGDDPTTLPIDYKVLVFNGRARRIAVIVGRDRGRLDRLSFDRAWNLLPVGMPRRAGQRPPPPDPTLAPERPACLTAMLEAAETLADDLSFVRVDFFVRNDVPYFTEMTFSPVAAFEPFTLRDDLELGSFLRLPAARGR